MDEAGPYLERAYTMADDLSRANPAVDEFQRQVAAIANDLHKGRDTGAAWKLLIDVAAALLTLVSLSGLILIFFIHKHRAAGLLALAAGGLLLGLVYASFVP